MSNTISGILRRSVLIPLVVVAVTMVFASSYIRYLDAKKTLQREQHIALQFLQEPAAQAIVLGSTGYLKKIVTGVTVASERFICIAIRDNDEHIIASKGRCPKTWPKDSTMTIYSAFDPLLDVKPARVEPAAVGDLLLIMNSDVFSAETRRIGIQLLFTSLAFLVILVMMNTTLQKRLVRPISRISSVVTAIRKQDYAQRIVGLNRNDELGQLAESLNDTIEDIDNYTTQLKTSRDDAKAALLAADDAYLSRESLMQSLSQDLAEPTKQMTHALTLLAMANKDDNLAQPIQHILKVAQDFSLNFDDLLAIATTDASDIAISRRSMSLSELLNSLEATISDTMDSLDFDIDYSVNGPSAIDVSDQMFITLDTQKLNRLLYHLCDAIIQQCIGTSISVVTHVVKLEEQSINISFDFRAFYPPDILCDSSESQTGNLPSFFNESARLLIQTLCRILEIDINHMHSKSGTFNLSASLTIPFFKGVDHASPIEQVTEKAPRIVVVSNDSEILKLSTRASLSKDTIKFIRPEQCYHSTPEFIGCLDCVAIDIGIGSGDDFDHQRIINIVKKIPSHKHVIFTAIVHPSVLSNTFIEQLISDGYSGTLQKPLTLGRLREELSNLIDAAKQAAHPFANTSEHD